jgi:hypothetical protein
VRGPDPTRPRTRTPQTRPATGPHRRAAPENPPPQPDELAAADEPDDLDPAEDLASWRSRVDAHPHPELLGLDRAVEIVRAALARRAQRRDQRAHGLVAVLRREQLANPSLIAPTIRSSRRLTVVG